MSKELLDVVDTAIKIGLGALISGVFTYLGIKLNKQADKKKYYLEHKVKLIEDTSESIHLYFTAWLSFSSTITGIAKHEKNKSFTSFDFSKYASVNNDDIKLINSWNIRDKAGSTLILLGDTSTYRLITKCAKLQNELRHHVTFENKLPSEEFMSNYTGKVVALKSEINNSLAKYYQKAFDS